MSEGLNIVQRCVCFIEGGCCVCTPECLQWMNHAPKPLDFVVSLASLMTLLCTSAFYDLFQPIRFKFEQFLSQLISSLANDLDHMLSELCTTPPPPYDRLSDNELHNR